MTNGLPHRSISGTSQDDSRFVDVDNLYDFAQMCSPEHNLVNNTIRVHSTVPQPIRYFSLQLGNQQNNLPLSAFT